MRWKFNLCLLAILCCSFLLSGFLIVFTEVYVRNKTDHPVSIHVSVEERRYVDSSVTEIKVPVTFKKTAFNSLTKNRLTDTIRVSPVNHQFDFVLPANATADLACFKKYYSRNGDIRVVIDSIGRRKSCIMNFPTRILQKVLSGAGTR